MSDLFSRGVTIEPVDDLYRRRDALDIPGYYQPGEANPFDGRCAHVPRSARYYAMVPEKEVDRRVYARLLLRGVGARRRVKEVLLERDQINFTQFAPPGRIAVLFV